MGFLQDTLEKFRNDKSWNTENHDGTHRFDKEIAWIEQMIGEYATALKMEPDSVAELNGSMELRSMTRELSELINKGQKEVTPMYPIIIKADTHTTYHEIDGIRLVFEDGVLRGWYNPNKDNDE